MKNKKNGLILGGVAIGSAIISSGVTLLVHSKWYCNTQYNYAADLYNEGKLKEALIEFEKLKGYKQADLYIRFCKETIARHQIEDMLDENDIKSASWMFDKVCEEGILSNRVKDILRVKLLKAFEEADDVE